MDACTILARLADQSLDLDAAIRKQVSDVQNVLKDPNGELLSCQSNLELVSALITLNEKQLHPDKNESKSSRLQYVHDKLIRPLIKELNNNDGKLNHLMEPLCRLYCQVQPYDMIDQDWLIKDCSHALRGGDESNDTLSKQKAIEILSCLFILSERYHEIANLLKSSTEALLEAFLPLVGTEYIGNLTTIVAKLLKLSDDSMGNCRMIWKSIVDPDTGVENSMLILCSLADHFLDKGAFCLELYGTDDFWRLVQSGLCSSDTLTRKRALYALKRVIDNLTVLDSEMEIEINCTIFKWEKSRRKELIIVWEDYILITEMMEEKQIHVIKPVMPRWEGVVKSTYFRTNNLTSAPDLHTSWLLVLLKRMSLHSSGLIVRWGLEKLLDLDCSKVPLMRQDGKKFLTGNLAKMLNVTSHYQHDAAQSTCACPPVAEKLAVFLLNLYQALESCERAEFFRNLIISLDSETWSGIPLMFCTRAFSLIQKTPVLDSSSLQVLRNICSKHIRTVSVNQRGAIQVFCTRVLMKFLDVNTTNVLDLIRFLAVIRSEESYTRGSPIWLELCDWIKTETWSSLSEEVHRMVRTLLGTETPYSVLPPSSLSLGFAKFVYLLFDSQLEFSEELLYPLFKTASTVHERLYLKREVADNALAAVIRLIDQQGSREVILKKLIDQSREALLDYSVQRLLRCVSLEETSLYSSSLFLLLESSGNFDIVSKVMDGFFPAIEKVSSTDAAEQNSALMAFLGLAKCCDVLVEFGFSGNEWIESWNHKSLVGRLTKIDIFSSLKRPTSSSEDSVSSRNWNSLVSAALEAQWRVLSYSLKYNTKPDPIIVDYCLSALDEGTNAVLGPVFECLTRIFDVLTVETDTIIGCIDICWRRLRDIGSCPDHFWPAYYHFIRMIWQEKLLTRDDLTQSFVQLIDDIQLAADDRAGMMYELASHWISLYNQTDYDFLPYIRNIVHMIKFGPVHKKGDKIVLDINTYTAALTELKPGRIVAHRDDYKVRALMASFLASLDRDIPRNFKFLASVGAEIMESWREITRTRRRHTFVNSLLHRETHRLMAALMLVQDILINEKTNELMEFLCEVLEKEGQPSVRFVAEWCLILILFKSPDKRNLIWDNLASNTGRKPSVLCSWLTILTHVAKLLEPDDRVQYLVKALPTALPLCMAHQFNLRIFGQACMLALWQLCQEDGIEKFDQISLILESVNNFVSMTGNSTRCTMTLLDHFSMKYHPLMDLSMQTIYETLPKLFSMNQDEWISPRTYEESVPDVWTSGKIMTVFPLRNSRSVLDHCRSGAWKMRAEEDDTVDVTIGDVQRKITPWKRMFPDEETEIDSPNKKENGGLILVASLIDKTPNLGGLCRTCEIFGASEFVMGSFSYMTDPQFINLSVSAQKWINITEVQPNYLRDYLLMQKRMGYTLIGVEQTNNSKCLTEYKFPEKTLLLLGNEKEGIPVDMIQLLDVCVEIPQQGVIRSLNVHVSGALIMWEYRRQQLLNKS